jgi:hypothetical protein
MWNLPEPRKFDRDVSLLATLPYTWGDSRVRQAVISRETRATLLRMPLVSAFITSLGRLLMISGSQEASEQEERSEHEAQSAAVIARLFFSIHAASSRAPPRPVVARLHRGR